MRKNIIKLLVGLSLMIGASNTWADGDNVKIAGTSFPTTAKVAGSQLTLNGVGLRTKAFFKVYALGLYVPKKSTSIDELLQVTGPRLVELHMLRDVEAKTFLDAFQEGLEDNNSKSTLKALKDQIATLEKLMIEAGKVKTGDIIKFEFNPANGTQVYINNQKQGSAIGGGADFYTAVLKVWLGKDPVDSDLKIGVKGG